MSTFVSLIDQGLNLLHKGVEHVVEEKLQAVQEKAAERERLLELQRKQEIEAIKLACEAVKKRELESQIGNQNAILFLVQLVSVLATYLLGSFFCVFALGLSWMVFAFAASRYFQTPTVGILAFAQPAWAKRIVQSDANFEERITLTKRQQIICAVAFVGALFIHVLKVAGTAETCFNMLQAMVPQLRETSIEIPGSVLNE